jgi:(1->4)-alpha-D-glucan 1-alpha-D-glucosylmutase
MDINQIFIESIHWQSQAMAVIAFHATSPARDEADGRASRPGSTVRPSFNSTYRLQFTPEFGFANAMSLADYFSELGISAIYASPVFEARENSNHGYDVTSFSRVREELGGENQLRRLIELLHARGIGWVQDIVPNHMAFDCANEILSDVLIYGNRSARSDFFDIDWNHPNAAISGRLVAPFLDGSLYDMIRNGHVRLCAAYPLLIDINGFRLPASSITYSLVTKAMNGGDVAALCSLPPEALSSDSDRSVRLLSRMVPGCAEYDAFENALERINADVNAVRRILQLQNFVPRDWKSSRNEINYRRFFAVNDLICVRIEDSENFDIVNSLLARLCRDGLFDGTRIDHIDGLSEPAEYLRRLRKATGNRYTVVEKILSANETPPHDWSAEGTTGYDFLNWSNMLMHNGCGVDSIRKFYHAFTETDPAGPEMMTSLKKETIGRNFQGDIEVISARMMSQTFRICSDYPTVTEMREALTEILARVPVYRTYIAISSSKRVNENGKSILSAAIKAAARQCPGLVPSLRCIESVLLLSPQDTGCLSALSRLQQLMPAVHAKSIEDTYLYRDIPLMSVNAIGHGTHEDTMTAGAFHDKIIRRFRDFPYSMNATSTHDTKIGEDLRMRISVLSELPDLWIETVRRWSARNRRFRKRVNGENAPDRNDEYRIYQTVVGSYPLTKNERRQYRERISHYLVKAMREASMNTSWDAPCTGYESACTEFARLVMNDLDAHHGTPLSRFVERIAFRGYLKSLSLAVLKLTCPGIPDIYCGSEAWNFSFVDPDNRRPVDFMALRKHMLRYRRLLDAGKQPSFSRSDFTSGFIKFHITARLLSLRRNNPDLFVDGEYIPLKLTHMDDRFLSFCRRKGGKWIAVCLPLFSYDVSFTGRQKFSGGSMKKCKLILPEDHPSSLISLFGTGRSVRIDKGVEDTIDVAELLVNCPVPVLVSRETVGVGND